MINKKFTNLQTDQVVTINEVFGDIAILDNDDRVSVQRLLDNKYFEEYIDPMSFFNNSNSFNILADKIKSIPDEVLQTLPERDSPRIDSLGTSQESAIIQSDPEEEKRLLMEKAKSMSVDSVVNSMQKQNQMFSEFLEDDEDGFIVTKQSPTEVQQPVQNYNTQPQTQVYNAPQPTKIEIEDPIITMFRGVKRKEKFSFDLKIEELIPRLDFIEMMEDSYQISIIDFLSDEFTKKLLSNSEDIKKLISEEIRKIVYSGKKTTKEQEKPKTTTRKKPATTTNRRKKPVERPIEKQITETNDR
jgi:hypothetical protein